MSWDTKEPSIVGDSRPITPGVPQTNERKSLRLAAQKRKEEKQPGFFHGEPLRVEFDPIGWIGLPPEDTRALTQTHARLSLPLMGAAAWSELFPDFRFNLSQLPAAAAKRSGRDFYRS